MNAIEHNLGTPVRVPVKIANFRALYPSKNVSGLARLDHFGERQSVEGRRSVGGQRRNPKFRLEDSAKNDLDQARITCRGPENMEKLQKEHRDTHYITSIPWSKVRKKIGIAEIKTSKIYVY